MKFYVCVNATRQRMFFGYDRVEEAKQVCSDMNMDAYRRGMGGMFGVYDEDGNRCV